MPMELTETEYILTDDFQLHFLELPKVVFSGRTALTSRIEKWLFFLKNEGIVEEEEEMEILLKDDYIFKKAHKEYEKFTADDKLVELNEARMKRIRDEASLIDGAREEGVEKGYRSKALETAKRMLAEGLDVDLIARVTDLTREEVESLQTGD